MYKKLFLCVISIVALSNHFTHGSERKPWGCGPWVAASSFAGAGLATVLSPIPAGLKVAITLGSGIIGGAIGFSIEQVVTFASRSNIITPYCSHDQNHANTHLDGIKTGIKLILPPLAFMIATTAVLLQHSRK